MKITFQGFSCSSASWRLSHGLTPDTSLVEIWVPDFRAIQFKPGRAPNVKGQGVAFEQPNIIYEIGDLTFETEADGNKYQHTAKDLYVSNVQKSGNRLPDGRGIITLTLLDVRRAWDFGWLKRWRYNLEDEPDRVTLAGVANDIVSVLPGASLVRVPGDWADISPPLKFDEFGSPREALRRILKQHRSVCVLNPDTSVSIYRENERGDGELPPEKLIEDLGGMGHIGGTNFNATPDACLITGGPRICSVKVSNWEPVLLIDGDPVPLKEALIFLSGGAPGANPPLPAPGAESDEEALAILYERYNNIRRNIMRVRLGAKQDILEEIREDLNSLEEVANQIDSLGGNSEQIRRFADAIRQGTFGEDPGEEPDRAQELFELVLRFMLRPDTWRVLNGFDEGSTEIIRRDAFQLWRLPGADSYNREMLPILPRAERAAKGTRLSPLVTAYTWKRVPHYLTGRPGAARLQMLRLERNLIQARNRLFDAYRAPDKSRIDAFAKLLASLTDAGQFFEPGGFRSSSLEHIIDDDDKERLGPVITNYKTAAQEYYKLALQEDPGFIGDLQDELSGKLYEAAAKAASNQASPIADLLREAAKDSAFLQALEDALNGKITDGTPQKIRDFFNTAGPPQAGTAAIKEFLAAREDIFKIVRKIIDRRAAARRSSEVGEARSKLPETYYFENTGVPIIDRGARVEDASRGLVRTSFIAGQLEVGGLPASSLPGVGSLAPGPGPDGSWPVSVVFGTRIVPRSSPPSPATGNKALLELDVLPPQAQEALRSGKPELGSYFSAWRRVGQGLVRSSIEELDPASTRAISNGRLVELIELSGATNVNELDRLANEQAASELSEPGVSIYRRTKYIHPHTIQLDGVVSATSIETRPGQIGFRTLVVEGITDKPFVYGNKTTTKRRRLDEMNRAGALPGELEFND